MNTTLGNSPAAEMRASDADRDAVLSDLSEHFQVGRLTPEEFEDRAGRALAARTWGELKDLLQDLPSTWPGPQAAAASSAARPARLSGLGAPAPIAVLAAIGIAVAVSVDITRPGWSLLWLGLGLLIVRRLIRCAGPPGSCGPRD